MRRAFLVVAVIACFTLCNNAVAGDKAKMTVKAVDEDGKPMAGISVDAKFLYGTERTGATDTNGLFILEGESGGWDTWYSLHKDGFYRSDGKLMLVKPENGRWQPWNPVVTAVVRRIVHPIPMYAKRVETELPSVDQPVGYDLAVGDWVAPFGKGNENDLILAIVHRRVTSLTDFDASLLMSFANARDGIQNTEAPNPFRGSAFAWSYASPEESYDITTNCAEIGYSPGKPFYRRNAAAVDGCYIRVRCVTNETGRIVSAYYGKMPAFITFDPRGSKTASIQFTYYLNPTPNDRNMEFDPKQNLFKNLKSTEQVTAP